jgi:DNA-binding transcriptional ArsR family regulator
MTPRGRTQRSPRGQFTTGRPNPPSLTAVADAKTLEAVFGALANDTRRGILAVLHDAGDPMRSSEIAVRFNLPWQAVSRHLRILTQAGLISCEVLKNGRAYSLERNRLQQVPGRWIGRVSAEGTRRADGKLVFDFAD